MLPLLQKHGNSVILLLSPRHYCSSTFRWFDGLCFCPSSHIFMGLIFFAFLAHCVKLLVLILLLGSKQHAFNMTFNIYAFWFTDTQNVHPKERRCANVYHTKCLRDQSKIYCLCRKPKTTAHLKIHRHIIIFAFL